ncbi:hypothetical protein ABMA27_000637 [Loxostege sticticalis]|uniref:Fibronectin type-III domain-containing protein n=1 Tax=Loxostege sticticalis TaxID=481309 RepID=A0ABR3HZQ6_LOXSC
MKKCLSFLLLVATAQAFVTKEVQDSKRQLDLPAPLFHSLHIFDRPVWACTIGWRPLPSTEDILGYRLVIREEVLPNTRQYAAFQELFIYGQDKSVAAVAELKQGLWYEYRIQAFTSRGYGPLSATNGFYIYNNDGLRQGQFTYSVMENSEN